MRWTEEEYQDFLRSKNRAKGTQAPAPKTEKRSKYGNIRTEVDGIKFDSRKEAEYYCQLKLLKQAGEIKDFGLQPKFVLQEGFEKDGKRYAPITYYADFVVDNLDGTTDIIDIKGVETQVFKIKQKMFEYKFKDKNLKVVKEV